MLIWKIINDFYSYVEFVYMTTFGYYTHYEKHCDFMDTLSYFEDKYYKQKSN